MDLVDPRLESKYVKEEVLRMIHVALQCTKKSLTHRPTMSSVVKMLEGHIGIQDFVLDSSNPSHDMDFVKFKTRTKQHNLNEDKSTSEIQTISMSTDGTWTESSISGPDLYPVVLDLEYWETKDQSIP